MSGASPVQRRHPAPSGARRLAWLLVVVALALVVPARGATFDRVTRDTAGGSGHPRAGSAHTWAGADTGAAKTVSHDRKTLPGGAATLAGLWILLLGAVVIVRRAHTLRVGKPSVAFRRRGPPVQRIAL